MKTEIILSKVREIDWSKPMWVIDTKGTIVFTIGEHSGDAFTGIALPCTKYPKGISSKMWDKGSFTSLTEPLTIRISND